MGDRPAAVQMEVTKRKTADMFGEIDMIAAKKIKEDSFIDDIMTGGTKDECERMKGTEDIHMSQCSGTIPQILGKGGFLVKAMAMSTEEDGKALQKLSRKVLGMAWSMATDMLEV